MMHKSITTSGQHHGPLPWTQLSVGRHGHETGMHGIIPDEVALWIPRRPSRALQRPRAARQGEFIHLQVSAHEVVVVDLWPCPINRPGIPLPQRQVSRYTTHWPVPLHSAVKSRPCLVGCKAARDLLVQALTQTAGNLWPPARNLRGSELVLDRGIRMAAHYGMLGNQKLDSGLSILGVLRDAKVPLALLLD